MTTEPQDHPFVLVLGSGYHLYREYLLRDISSAARVWLLTPRAPTWEQRYIAGWSIVNALNLDQALAAARAVAEREEVCGVICWDELLTLNAAHIAHELGLPCGGEGAVSACRDKLLTRRALDARGVPQPRFTTVLSAAEALIAAAELGYPVVVKPRGLGASIGVTKVVSERTLVEAYHHASTSFEDGVQPNCSVLVEEAVSGEEVSIDCAIVNGEVFLMFVGRKIVGFAPHCEEVGHVVDAQDPLLTDPALAELLAAAHAAVGFITGITHTEVMLTTAGPRLIEINSRLGGDLIPFVASVAMGLQPGRIAVDVSRGRIPDLNHTSERVARVDFSYPDRDCTVLQVVVSEDLPASVHTVAALASPGQTLQLPPTEHVSGRSGYVITCADTAQECANAARDAASAIHLVVCEPLEQTLSASV